MEEAKKLTLEEKRRRFEERLASDYYIRPAKPKLTPVLSLPVSEKIADAVKANPASLLTTLEAKPLLQAGNHHHLIRRGGWWSFKTKKAFCFATPTGTQR